MTIVVTGAAGHVGTNLCLALLADGHDVRAVDLREPVRAVRHGARWVKADVRDAAAMGRVVQECKIVYHLAAVISIVGGLRGLVHSVNVDGVRIVAQAALEHRVPRFVHCSSVHAFDLAAVAGRPVDESAPRAQRPQLPAYDRSKAAGEVELRRIVDRGLDAVMVNPTGIIGPLDDAPSRMGAVLLALWRRRLPALVPGGFDWVDVRDVVQALRAAAARGRTGESYLVAGHRVSIGEMARLAAAVRGTPVTRRTAPYGLARAVAPVAEPVVRWTGWPLLPTREALHALESFPTIDGTKARRELGHEPRPFQRTLADLHAYFVETGRLRAPRAVA
jgi:Nucleoside-diphosphate-sugar epimerases